jgi:hypothetical protein
MYPWGDDTMYKTSCQESLKVLWKDAVCSVFISRRLLSVFEGRTSTFGVRGHLAYAGATRRKKWGHLEELAGPSGV